MTPKVVDQIVLMFKVQNGDFPGKAQKLRADYPPETINTYESSVANDFPVLPGLEQP